MLTGRRLASISLVMFAAAFNSGCPSETRVREIIKEEELRASQEKVTITRESSKSQLTTARQSLELYIHGKLGADIRDEVSKLGAPAVLQADVQTALQDLMSVLAQCDRSIEETINLIPQEGSQGFDKRIAFDADLLSTDFSAATSALGTLEELLNKASSKHSAGAKARDLLRSEFLLQHSFAGQSVRQYATALREHLNLEK